MNLMPLANRLVAAGVGRPGESLFIEHMPGSTERAILLRNPLSGTRINYELPGYYRTEFQLIARCRTYPDGELLMRQALAALTLLVETAVEDHLFQFCRPRTEPVAFPLSQGNLLEWSVMFDVAFVTPIL